MPSVLAPAMPRSTLFPTATTLLSSLLLLACDAPERPKTPADVKTRGTLAPVSVNMDVRLAVHDFKGGQAASENVKNGALVGERLEAGFFDDQKASFYNKISASNIDADRKRVLLSSLDALFDDIRSDVDAGIALLPRTWSFHVIGGSESAKVIQVDFPDLPAGPFSCQGSFEPATTEFLISGVVFQKPPGSAPARAVPFARCSLSAFLNTGQGTYGCGANSTRTVQSAGAFDISVTYRLGLTVARTP